MQPPHTPSTMHCIPLPLHETKLVPECQLPWWQIPRYQLLESQFPKISIAPKMSTLIKHIKFKLSNYVPISKSYQMSYCWNIMETAPSVMRSFSFWWFSWTNRNETLPAGSILYRDRVTSIERSRLSMLWSWSQTLHGTDYFSDTTNGSKVTIVIKKWWVDIFKSIRSW